MASPARTSPRPRRLIADAMLGGLAKWLRILGFDTAYDPALDDAEIVERSVEEGRTILTRDRRLILRRRASNHLFIRSEVVEDQVGQVLEELGLKPTPEALFSRCVRCNAPLVGIPPEEAAPQVPAYVARTQDRFRRCPECGRIYWRATHAERIRRRLRGMGIRIDD